MLRRDFLRTVAAAAVAPALQAAPRLKVTDVRLVPLKVLRETGKMEAAWNPGVSTMRRLGGGAYLEIHTDQGLIGIGPDMSTGSIEGTKAQLVGKDPFNIEQLAGPLRYYVGGRAGSSIEIPLWDLGATATQQQSYQLCWARQALSSANPALMLLP